MRPNDYYYCDKTSDRDNRHQGNDQKVDEHAGEVGFSNEEKQNREGSECCSEGWESVVLEETR